MAMARGNGEPREIDVESRPRTTFGQFYRGLGGWDGYRQLSLQGLGRCKGRQR